jgi:RIO kinase 1
MLLRDVDNLRDLFGRVNPHLLPTRYGEEIWGLYESGGLTPETPLTGQFVRKTGAVDLGGVMREIDDTREEEAQRRLRRAQGG